VMAIGKMGKVGGSAGRAGEGAGSITAAAWPNGLYNHRFSHRPPVAANCRFSRTAGIVSHALRSTLAAPGRHGVAGFPPDGR